MWFWIGLLVAIGTVIAAVQYSQYREWQRQHDKENGYKYAKSTYYGCRAEFRHQVLRELEYDFCEFSDPFNLGVQEFVTETKKALVQARTLNVMRGYL